MAASYWERFGPSTILLCVLLAGCVADPDQALESRTEAPAPVVDADTGSLTGLVLNEESQPIEGADVGLAQDGAQAVESDASGRYTINGITPGNITVHASRIGFEMASKRVTVVAGETTTLSFTLVALPVDLGPRSELRIHDGMIQGPAFASWFAYQGAGGSVNVPLARGAEEVVMAMQWNANTPTTSKYLGMSVGFDGTTNATVGRSPIHANISDLGVSKEDKALGRYYITYACNWNPTPDHNCLTRDTDYLVPVVVYQQQVKLYSTVFYGSRAPSGYTGLPPP